MSIRTKSKAIKDLEKKQVKKFHNVEILTLEVKAHLKEEI